MGTRSCNKRNFEHKPRVPAGSQIAFSVDERRAALVCRDEQPESRSAIRILMTDQSQTTPRFRPPLRVQDLSPGQRSLVELMHVHQFGRIENMPVRAGEPVFNSDVKVVRVARLGSGNDAANLTRSDEFHLKRQVRDLFEELERLQEGTVIRLEFKHGLPLLLETTSRTTSSG